MFHVEQMADPLGELLARGAEDLGRSLSPAQARQLVDYLRLLDKWNAKLNLVGPGSLAEWAVRHVLDSLAPLPWVVSLSAGQRVLDIGSGAGLPGIPLAVAAPEIGFRLLEPRSNRVAFLQAVTAALKLANVKVHRGRAEDEVARYARVVGRAVAPPDDYAGLAGNCLASDGRFVLFHQQTPPERIGRAELVEQRIYEIQGSPPRAVGLYRMFHVEPP